MIAGSPARSMGFVVQKSAPLVSEAFSSRVRSATISSAGRSRTDAVASVEFRVSVIGGSFRWEFGEAASFSLDRLDRPYGERAEHREHDADREEAGVAEREHDRAGDAGRERLRQGGGDVDDAEVLRERLRR